MALSDFVISYKHLFVLVNKYRYMNNYIYIGQRRRLPTPPKPRISAYVVPGYTITSDEETDGCDQYSSDDEVVSPRVNQTRGKHVPSSSSSTSSSTSDNEDLQVRCRGGKNRSRCLSSSSSSSDDEYDGRNGRGDGSNDGSGAAAAAVVGLPSINITA